MSHFFNGKVYIEPSAGAKIITNVAPSPNLLSTGIVLVIGESDGGNNYEDGVIYKSDQPNFLKSILRGGVSNRCINFIFNPSVNTPGAQQVFFIRAQAATKATATITQSTGGNVTFVLTSKDRGAYLSDSTTGLKWKLIAGVDSSSKHILLLQLDGVLAWTSPEVSTYQELIDAIAADSYAANLISAAVTSGTATTNIDNTVRTSSYATFTGGTSPAMTGTDVDAALTLAASLTQPNFIFIASTDATFHAKVLSFIVNVSEFPMQAFFGGAANETKAQVKARSLNLNSENAILAYPDITVAKEDGSGVENLSPMYFAAHLVGLKAGLPPYEPITWKRVNVLGFAPYEGDLSKADREDMIRKGISYGRNVPGIGFAVNKGVNTLQTNASMIYKKTDGSATSPEISIISIKNQLIKELVINSATLFIGGTAATVTREDVINFTRTYLNAKTATPVQPNDILGFEAVVAELNDDAWFVNFGFYPNTPINFLFFTGAMLKSRG